MSEELMMRISLLEDGNAWPSTIELINDLADRITALIAAGDKLAGFAWHESGCERLQWIERPCNCGYTEAWKAWKEATQ